jgi:NTE family protein
VSLAASTTIDTQDRYPYPREGMLMLLSYTSAQEALGSARTFSKFSARYEVCISDGNGRITIIPRLQFGYGDRTMPRTEDFRLGGLYSFIGMRENEFSGRQLLLGCIEARYKAPFDILFDTYLSLRYNLGRTWEIPEQIKFDDLRHGAGISVGLDTPIGPADFGIGRGFTFMQDVKPFIRWGPLNMYFSIGVSM